MRRLRSSALPLWGALCLAACSGTEHPVFTDDGADSDTDVDTDADSDADTDVDTDTGTDSETDSGTGTDTDTGTGTGTDSGSDSGSDTDTGTESESISDTGSESGTDTGPCGGDEDCGAGERCDAGECVCDPAGDGCNACGDLTGNGIVDIDDVLACSDLFVRGGPYTCCEMFEADGNRDGSFTESDCEDIFAGC